MKLFIALIFTVLSFGAMAEPSRKPGKEVKAPNVHTNKLRGWIEFTDEFNEATIEALIYEMEDALGEGDKEIVIKLESGGGSIFAGFKLINFITRHQSKGIKFRGIVGRFCASMCFMTLQHLDKREAYPYAIILDHPSSGGSDKANLVQISELLQEIIIKKMVAKGLSPLAIKLYQLNAQRDFMINTTLAIELGLLDKVIQPGKEYAKKKEPKKSHKRAEKKEIKK